MDFGGGHFSSVLLSSSSSHAPWWESDGFGSKCFLLTTKANSRLLSTCRRAPLWKKPPPLQWKWEIISTPLMKSPIINSMWAPRHRLILTAWCAIIIYEAVLTKQISRSIWQRKGIEKIKVMILPNGFDRFSKASPTGMVPE